MIPVFVRRRTLEQGFSFSTALLVVILMGTTMAVVRNQVQASLRRGLEARGVSLARSIGAMATPSLLAYNYAALQIAAEGAADDRTIAYVVIHDKEGSVAGVAGRAAHPLRAPVGIGEAAGKRTRDLSLLASDGEPTEVLEVAIPVDVEGVDEAWGLVRVGLCYGPVRAEMNRLLVQLLVLGAALTVVAVASVRWVARRITRPLRELVAGTEALAGGDTSHRIPESGPRELADLARSFNVMVDRVRDKASESAEFQSALEALNEGLEHQVYERTRALEESEAQYKTLVEHSPDSILICQDGRVCFVNSEFTETFGVSETEVLSHDFDLGRIFDPSSASLVLGRLAAWERGESASTTEVLGRDASGTVRHLELRGSRIEYRGRPAAECLLVDKTEAVRLHERLSETEKLRALGELAGGVAHDFNNLLGAILGRVQLLRQRAFPPDVDRDMAVIEKAAQDGRETVRRIQEFSRTRRDRTFVPVDLAEILGDVVEITRSRWRDDAARRNGAVQVDLDAPVGHSVLGNAAELREVFTNLVLNALDAMPQGGLLHVSCREERGRVVARVSDNGVGMTEEIRRQLFDPFFTTKGSRGMGLGMSVVYGIVLRHEGTIEVDSSLGDGTTFTVAFPACRDAIPVAGGDGAAMPHLARPGRILVIDDEPEVAAVVADALATDGHIVDLAMCGEDGVRQAACTAYDLVFTDLGMPDLTGWEVAERIRQRTPTLPVALVSGWGASLDEDEARRRGIVAVVHKPFDIGELLRTAARLLSESSNEV